MPRKIYADVPVRRPPGVMFCDDLAGLWQVTPRTVYSYLYESDEGGRYAHHPVPKPDGYMTKDRKHPWWFEHRRTELAGWATARLTQSHGTTAPGRRKGEPKGQPK